jgi:hypothetical protein
MWLQFILAMLSIIGLCTVEWKTTVLGKMWNEAVVIYFKVLSRNSPGETEKTHEKVSDTEKIRTWHLPKKSDSLPPEPVDFSSCGYYSKSDAETRTVRIVWRFTVVANSNDIR